MKIYHYTRIDKWDDIKRGSWKSREKPGLGASRRLGRTDLEAWETAGVFGLLEPIPPKWTQSEHFKNIWGHLKGNIGELLLEIEVDADKDSDVFVLDRGHVEGFLYEDKKGIPDKYIHDKRGEAERAYMESKIPIKDYLSKQNELDYSLPEIIITKDTPFEKLNISEFQPLVEEELTNRKGEYREELVNKIKSIPELKQWFDLYQERSKELRQEREKNFREKRR